LPPSLLLLLLLVMKFCLLFCISKITLYRTKTLPNTESHFSVGFLMLQCTIQIHQANISHKLKIILYRIIFFLLLFTACEIFSSVHYITLETSLNRHLSSIYFLNFIKQTIPSIFSMHTLSRCVVYIRSSIAASRYDMLEKDI